MDEKTKLMTNALLDGAYRATGYILGPQQLKAFVRSFGEVSMEHILSAQGLELKGTDAATAATAWVNAETKVGLHAGDHTEIEADGDGFQATYTDCAFAETCGEILADLISQNLVATEDLPCMRCSFSVAAVSKATGNKAKYKMLQHAPGFRCRCSVNPI